MWGIEFQEANNSLICAGATFEVRHREERRDTSIMYCIGMHPGGTWIDRQDYKTGEWERIAYRAEPEDIEAILTSDFGFDWTYSDFMIALTFWGEGHKRGYNQRRYE